MQKNDFHPFYGWHEKIADKQFLSDQTKPDFAIDCTS